jgi:hypothetical protein
MSWPLGHDHVLSAQEAKRFGCGKYQHRVRVDGIAGSVVHQIGLQDYGLASDIDRKEPQTGREDLIKFLGVVLCVQDRNS